MNRRPTPWCYGRSRIERHLNKAAVPRCANRAQVVVTGRRQEALDAAVADIGNMAFAIRGDVSDLTHHDQVIAEESSVDRS
jgi:NAD(P)-dependent dehydrogenase (short-subunit alcohol dehydrogenase family)